MTLGSLAQTYDGLPKNATATTTPTGLTVSITYDGSTNPPVQAGSYETIGTIAAVNYNGSATDTLVIAQAEADVTLSDMIQTYDGTPKSVTVTTIPGGLSVTVTYDGSTNRPVSTGSYAVVATITEVNYQGSGSDTLVISGGATNTPFEDWLESRALDPQSTDYGETADMDGDGMTTYEEYIADTAPDQSNSVLQLTGDYLKAGDAGGETGRIEFTFPASTGRFYQLEYLSDLEGSPVVSNLGWGVPGWIITNETTGTWFGAVRVRLTAP